MAADFGDDVNRESQADRLDGVDIASIFIRFESGHSTEVSIDHCPFVPTMFDLRYLIHGTNERKTFRLSGISACFLVALVVAELMFILFLILSLVISRIAFDLNPIVF